MCAAQESAAKKAVLAPFVEGILSKLMGLMQSPRKINIDCAITAVASMATIVGADFLPFYDHFMPGLKGLVAQCPPEMSMVRAKAIECISHVGHAVGKEKFAPDAHEVMQHMASSMQALGEDSNSPCARSFCMESVAWEQ